ncbi:DEAD/DEAH box helicase family protein [Nocardia tengchongensis]|uniref:DEAD/DEAH box helicase n=1 Tax=Nocardia tengchongensis TaxID=2055889 RepID=UPI0034115C0F
MPQPDAEVWATPLSFSNNAIRQLLAPAGAHWSGSRQMSTPTAVLESYRRAIGFQPPDEPNSLRRPQIGALHSIVGYQSSGLKEPAVVVMPTGTGKTDTMVAWMVASRPERLLVLVPSAALRDQIASKFESLGILKTYNIIASSALAPCVGRIEHKFSDATEAVLFAKACNVIIATPNVLNTMAPEVRASLLDECTHLVVDEAHHAPATTWRSVIRDFGERPVLLFTATPFRSDGKAMPGRTIFRFPLREAQAEGYFSRIEFTSVLGIDDADRELAQAAVSRLKSDRANGLDHVLLARAGKRSRAEEVHALYSQIAPEFRPIVIHHRQSGRQRAENLQTLKDGGCRIVVCVDMLGEGFDMPTLKVAAFHDNRRSLSPLVQLVGRLARTESPTLIGTASVFVTRDPTSSVSPLRDLLREDPDWDRVLSRVVDGASDRAETISEFDASFALTPADVPVGLLQPKMSAIAFRSQALRWEPEAARSVYGDAILDDVVSVSAADDLCWFVLESLASARWGAVPGLESTTYDLVVMYFDADRGLLFIHGSDTKKEYDNLAAAVLGGEPTRIRSLDTFRVFAGLDRLVPNNVGLLDARDRDKRFSLHVGSDVELALNEAERNHKTNTHIAGKAYDNGERVTIAAAVSGRFWAMQAAPSLADWRDWCRRQGTRLLDDSVDLRSLFREMIIPVAVNERPPYPLLAMEWPWEFYLGTGTSKHIQFADSSYLLTDVGFRVDDHSDDGPFRLSVVTPTWTIRYTAQFGPTGLHYQPVDDDAHVENSQGESVPLSEHFNKNKPTLFLSGDRLLTGDDRLLEPRTDLAPFDRSRLQVIDWHGGGVDITVESQGRDRKPESIQAFMSRHLRSTQAFDILVDDDRSGEAADLVGVRIDRDDLLITLVHCKYSSDPIPGHRLADLYEVCGQAMRGARWREQGAEPLFAHLERRTRHYQNRTGQSPFETGDRETLFRIREKAPRLFPRVTTVVVQPGLSAAESSDEQLRLLAGAESYVRAVTKGSFLVYCSA